MYRPKPHIEIHNPQFQGNMRIVIVGGGFAGVNLALDLAKSKDHEIILVDKNNYNFFPPLIYQVATAFLEPSSISYPFRKFALRNVLHFAIPV